MRRAGTARRGLGVLVTIVALSACGSAGGHASPGGATTTATGARSSVPPTTGLPVPTTKPAVAGDPCSHAAPPRGSTRTYAAAPPMTIDSSKTYTATMTTSCGTITMTLDPKDAPQTVNSFVFLARAHFYDGLTFHRVVPDFVVQGGDPKGDGTGGPGYSLPTEPPKNGYVAGSVAMANAGAGTTGSQFFLVVSASGAQELGGPPYLYSILGQITTGLDVVEKMETFAPSSGDGPPTRPLYIDHVTISES